MSASVEWNYDEAELKADGAVHVASVVFAVVGATVVAAAALRFAPPVTLFGVGVYAVSLVVTLGLSAAYNMWPVSPLKWLLRRFDHAGIFLLIAGTYTPFALQLGSPGRRFLLGIWCVTLLGMAFKLLFCGRFARLAVLFYLALGWSGLYLFGELSDDLRPLAVALILAGGLVYSSGVIFYVWEKLRFQNVIWHGFVLAGAACHYAAVLLTVMAFSQGLSN